MNIELTLVNFFNVFVFMGLMCFMGYSGATFYNSILYSIYDDKNLAQEEKELSLTVYKFCGDVAVLGGSFLSFGLRCYYS